MINFQHFQGQNIYFNKMPAPPPPQNQMVVPQLRTQNGSTSLGEKSDEQETHAMLAEFSATYRNLQLPVVHVSD